MADYILNMGGQGASQSTSNYSAVVDVFKATVDGVEHITDHGLSLKKLKPKLLVVRWLLWAMVLCLRLN